MTKQTASLSLSKPEITDKIVDTITQLASNFDVIDSSLADLTTNKLGWLNLTQPPYNVDKAGIVDCTTIINNAITTSGATYIIYLPIGTYLISSSVIIPSNVIFICEGTIKFNGSGNIVEIRGQYSKVRINKIISTSLSSNGISLNPVSTGVYYNEIEITHIECTGYGIFLDSSTYGNGIQHNHIKFGQIFFAQYGIYLLCSTGWIGENIFDCGRIGADSKHSTIGIYLVSSSGSNITGSKFYHPALEGLNEGIVLSGGRSTVIKDARNEESIDSNVLRVVGPAYANITFAYNLYINKLDFSQATGYDVWINSTIMNSQGSVIANELRHNDANIRLKPREKKYINLSSTTFTLTADQVYYYFWATNATTLNLNQYYGNMGIEEFIIKLNVGCMVYNSAGTLIFDGSTLAGKTYILRFINQTTVGTNGWLAEQIG